MMNIIEADMLLAEAFGRYSEQWQPSDPLEKLIYNILHQRTTHAHASRALANLQAQRPGGWAAVAAMDHDSLVELVRPAGLAEQKAGRVQGILEQLFRDTGTYSLDFLVSMANADSARYLRSLPGVGDHTAALLLLFALGRRGVMPVEAHVHRMAIRLGWVPREATLRAVQLAIESAAPDLFLMDLHVNLIRLSHQLNHPQERALAESLIDSLSDTPWRF